MSIRMPSCALAFSVAVLTLSGCGVAKVATTSALPATPSNVGGIAGRAMGGQQPITGAKVYLFAVSTTGTGTPSVSLITGGLSDPTGGYVLSDSGGNFSLGGKYTCIAGQYVYAYVKGGNPGAGVNSMVGLMAVLGTCPSTGTLAANVPFVIVNEVSTIAAAYALSGFAVDPVHVSGSGSGYTAANSGLKNAVSVALALNGVANASGANAVTPTGVPVPFRLINTLGNVLAACINSAGPASPACITLQANAANDAAVQPSDTAYAAINIAHHQAANVGALYALATSTSPFQPSLTEQPSNFVLMLGITKDVNAPGPLAVDGDGAVWTPNATLHSLNEFFPDGTTTYPTDTGGDTPVSVGIDTVGRVWYADQGTQSVNAYSATTGAAQFDISLNPTFTPNIAPQGDGFFLVTDKLGAQDGLSYRYYGNGQPALGNFNHVTTRSYAVAVDTNNFYWITSNSPTQTTGARLVKFRPNDSGVDYFACVGSDYAQGTGVAIDSGNNVWVSDFFSGKVVKFANTCDFATSYPTVSAPIGLSMDGNNTLYAVNNAGTLGVTNTATGTLTSYPLGIAGTLGGVVVDNSGNVWVSSTSGNTVYYAVGLATPVLTPLALGAQAGKLGQRP